MSRPTPHSLLPEADAFELVALGLASALEAFDRRLACAASGDAPPLPADDPALLAALGLVSLRRTAGRWLRQACPPAAPSEGAESPPAPRDLLR
jgi:hypothetical protein